MIERKSADWCRVLDTPVRYVPSQLRPVRKVHITVLTSRSEGKINIDNLTLPCATASKSMHEVSWEQPSSACLTCDRFSSPNLFTMELAFSMVQTATCKQGTGGSRLSACCCDVSTTCCSTAQMRAGRRDMRSTSNIWTLTWTPSVALLSPPSDPCKA